MYLRNAIELAFRVIGCRPLAQYPADVLHIKPCGLCNLVIAESAIAKFVNRSTHRRRILRAVVQGGEFGTVVHDCVFHSHISVLMCARQVTKETQPYV